VIHPWQQAQWQRIGRARAAGRVPHALLLAGAPGTGKHDFARALARSLLCTAAAHDAEGCGACKSCRLFAAGTHPDFMTVLPEEPGRAIRIDAVRAIIGFTALHCHYGRSKIVLLAPAEAMNRAAANSLLKTLEEPPGAAVLLLVSHRPGILPATVRSRCQRLAFDGGARDAAVRWLAARLEDPAPVPALLELAGGAPLAALALAEAGALEARRRLAAELAAVLAGEVSPITVAAGWTEAGTARVLAAVQGLIRDLVAGAMTGAGPGTADPQVTAHLHAIANAVDLRALFDFHARVEECARLLRAATGLREQALLEELLLFLAGAADHRERSIA